MSNTQKTFMKTNEPTYPPQLHKPVSRTAAIEAQPSITQNMSVNNSPQLQKEEHAANRLRGGCIPCPVRGCCFIIPLPCC
ncbi:hypothetical protein BDN70DRAFT_539383 [Pholiota conissans]|uniref:Uncharacterized protein n=1 Tax=Pholiota conissans TaxID=109636 RepID=A0A9P5ZEV2_9AGAR|nr:hypothetical protein BDN70DRAFT_539383 [Pholiota conissans]